MDIKKIKEVLESAEYRFAKTMPRNPHWYTLRRTWKDNKLFDEVVKYIRENAYVEYFRGRPYQVFFLGEYKYWTMGAPIKETTLINRTFVKRTTNENDQKTIL